MYEIIHVFEWGNQPTQPIAYELSIVYSPTSNPFLEQDKYEEKIQ